MSDRKERKWVEKFVEAGLGHSKAMSKEQLTHSAHMVYGLEVEDCPWANSDPVESVKTLLNEYY